MKDNHQRDKLAGFVATIIGTVFILLGMLKNGAAEFSDTLNVGLLNDKTNLVLTGGFIVIAGTVLVTGHAIISAISALETKNIDCDATKKDVTK